MGVKKLRSIFDPTIPSHAPLKIVDDPYVQFRFDRRLHNGFFFTFTGTENAQCDFSLASSEYESIDKYSKKWVGIKAGSGENSMDVTVDIDVIDGCDYRVEYLILRGSDYNGTIQPIHNGNVFGKKIDTKSSWSSQNWFKSHLTPCRSGTNTFGVRISKGCYLGAIKIVPVVRCIGDSDGTYYGENEISVLNADWSRNSINEVNNAVLNLAFLESYFQTDHKYSAWIFSLMDSLTISVGEKRSKTSPVFGGYLVGWKRTKKELALHCQDALLNLQKGVMYENYAVGTPPDEAKQYIQFGNVSDTIRYMVETTLHHLNSYNVPVQNGFKIDFSTIEEYNQIAVSGFEKERNATQGNPGYCLKLYRDSIGTATAKIYENLNNPYNAVTYPILNIDYKAADEASAMDFDIFITMHKQGEEIIDAEEYAVNFTGVGGHSNTIATVDPLLNGEWNYLSLNLPTLFKNIGETSAEHYISKIEFEGTIASTSPAGAMYFDNISSYKEINDTTRHSNEEVKSIFDIVQDLGDKTRHAIYIQPGLERCDDVVVAQPYQNSTLPVVVSSESNLVDWNEYGSMPLEDGFVNQAHTSFNISDETIGTSFKEKLDSIIHYEEFERHEFDNDLNSQVDVDNATQKRLDSLCSPSEYLDVTILGNPFLEPYQNIYYAVDENRCKGYGMVKTITYGYDPSQSPKLTADLGINRSSQLYDDLLFKIYRDVYNINLTNRNGGDVYRSRIS